MWDKVNITEKFSMSMCEYAWTSFPINAKLFRHTPQGTAAEKRVHPTQKPVALYRWVLGLLAKPGDRVLDTHAGSGSCLVACQEMGFEWMGFEIDPVYHAAAVARVGAAAAQVRIHELT